MAKEKLHPFWVNFSLFGTGRATYGVLGGANGAFMTDNLVKVASETAPFLAE